MSSTRRAHMQSRMPKSSRVATDTMQSKLRERTRAENCTSALARAHLREEACTTDKYDSFQAVQWDQTQFAKNDTLSQPKTRVDSSRFVIVIIWGGTAFVHRFLREGTFGGTHSIETQSCFCHSKPLDRFRAIGRLWPGSEWLQGDTKARALFD